MKKAMMNRKSERSYNGKPLSEDHEKRLMAYLEDDKNRIGINGNVITIHYQKAVEQKSEKIGTYGVIKKAPAYLITACKNNEKAMLDCGYVFEKLVLYLESMGIATCWLGGTFNRNKINQVKAYAPDTFIPIISPIGYSAGKKTLTDRFFRRMAHSDSRKDFDSLFYDQEKSVIEDTKLRKQLTYVRIAPSASNQQPWRIVIDSVKNAHFYLNRTPKYANQLGYDIQMIDMGIALCHYELATGKKNYFEKTEKLTIEKVNWEYVISVSS
ncbi:nitroreductase family protein [Petrocella sp. FN5]|uniref:nitroreductase family protein n=1 Tax=Petrocella sp. FN5 TaxID=3032002 RepID=UPI0023D9EDBD|nr:nitroreductase family protein [Petrocella sp. FN5]MDF1617880.1 nitroreductase family protein [Petrocella sp. FN5]